MTNINISDLFSAPKASTLNLAPKPVETKKETPVTNNTEPKTKYDSAADEIVVLHAKAADHMLVLQRILRAKDVTYGLTSFENKVFVALTTAIGKPMSVGKIESEAMMTDKIATRTFTLADILKEIGNGCSDDYERTFEEEIVWDAVRSVLVGRSKYAFK